MHNIYQMAADTQTDTADSLKCHLIASSTVLIITMSRTTSSARYMGAKAAALSPAAPVTAVLPEATAASRPAGRCPLPGDCDPHSVTALGLLFRRTEGG